MTAGSEGVVPATQGDRDAAARYVSNEGLCYRTATDIELGRHDKGRLVQAFARHRLSALADQRDERGGECYLCAGKCRGHSAGDPGEWEPEPGSQAARDAAEFDVAEFATPTDTRGGESALIDCAFVDCPPGLFRYAGMLCFKSEYSSKPGQQDAYCVDSGEYFWGGTSGDLGARRALIVTPLAALASPAAPGGVGEDDLAQRCAEILKWRRTGIYRGTALQALADTLSDKYPVSIRAAEDRTIADALALLAARPPLSGDR